MTMNHAELSDIEVKPKTAYPAIQKPILPYRRKALNPRFVILTRQMLKWI